MPLLQHCCCYIQEGKLDLWDFCCYCSEMAGRHKKPDGEAKSYMLRIRMTEDDRALLEQAAKSRTLDTSTWARSELVSLAKKLLGKK